VKHWFKEYRHYWGGFIIIVLAQAAMSTYQAPESWDTVTTFFLFFAAYLVVNLVVAGIIMLLTWPVRRNFDFSRFIKTLIAFAAVYGISQLISIAVVYFQR
jgi:hypothetical protein